MKTWLWLIAPLVVVVAIIWYLFLPVAEVATVRRGTAFSAVYGTVRIEPTDVLPVRAQNAGFITLADPFASGRAAIGKSVEKGQLLATIADESTARLLKQARADLQAATQRAALPLPSSELLKTAEDNLQRLEKLAALNNVPTVEYEKAKNEANRLRGAVENERIERDRNLETLQETIKKLEAQMKNSEIRAPTDGLLSNIQAIDGELVAEGNPLFTVSSRKNYVRGEVNEEDVGEVKPGMKAMLHLYAYRADQFTAQVRLHSTRRRSGDAALYHRARAGKHARQFDGGHDRRDEHHYRHRENVLLVPTRALLVDQVWVVKRGVVQKRTAKVGYRTLDFAEVSSGLSLDDHVVLSDQDRLRPGQAVRQRKVNIVAPPPPPAK